MGCGTSNAATSNVSQPSSSSPPPPHQQQQSSIRRGGGGAHHPIPPLASIPLSPVQPYRHGSPITQGELNNARNEFWSTRVEGHQQIWQTLRSVAEAILSEDLPLANAILEASSLTTPNGSLEVVYDDRGGQYKIPQYCYANPQELTYQPIQPSSSAIELQASESVPSNTNPNNPNNNPPSSSSNSSSSPLKLGSSNSQTQLSPSASGTVLLGPLMKLKIRINPGDSNLTIAIDSGGTVEKIKQVIVKEVEEKLPHIKQMNVQRQRIIFMGKELPNNLKVKDCKFDDTKVVQVFLRPV